MFKTIIKRLKQLYWLGFGMGLFLVFSGLLLVAQPERVRAWTPVAGDLLGSQTLLNLDKFDESGSFALPAQVAQDFGASTISWIAGQRPVDALPAGIWDTAFKIGQLSPAQINPLQNMAAAGLGNFGYIKNMSIANLVKGIPNLASLDISSVPAIQNLITAATGNGIPAPMVVLGEDVVPATKIGQLLNIPSWQSMALGSNGNNLASLAASSIPGLANTPIGNFPQALSNPASLFPGLPQMPIITMPGFNIPAGYQVGKVDAIRTKEPVIRKVISGSKETPNANCTNANCNHLEIQGLGNPLLNGAQIVDGDTQMVSGGYGFLKMVAGGIEKAGMQPYGEPIQEVYSGFNAQAGKLKRSWYFNYCNHGWIDYGCTPHFIGPIPIGGLQEGSTTPLLLGNISIPVTAPIPSIPIPSLPTVPSLPSIPSIPSLPSIPTIPTIPTFNLTKLNTNILSALPTANASDITSLLATNSTAIDPVTSQKFTPAEVVKMTIEQLISGVGAPSGNAISLGLGVTVDDIVAQVKTLYAA